MITLKRTNSEDIDFKNLVVLLNQDLKIRDGADHDFYNQFNGIDTIKHAIVIYEDEVAIGCGAFREKENDVAEIKRMFVHPDYRKRGIASAVLKELEKWATEVDYKYTLLETGVNQPEAIALYKKQDYAVIPNYPPYDVMDNSVCMKKKL
ncbi:GNAT family N-acetyltransferase [Flavobacterium branchiarum]|uniref:GNAT family N-acetyltransferase n=1 Tax=Flavobacterium branchiarum TaxID=1114870 RepID=A0ABV5FK69_9FLAO|nr:GNAT family N-acetyltransferase [Flavobacterium branchiarum]MDN3672384.1 GNAT family N-acetyltransferase [Flavobacterium branchiarum]